MSPMSIRRPAERDALTTRLLRRGETADGLWSILPLPLAQMQAYEARAGELVTLDDHAGMIEAFLGGPRAARQGAVAVLPLAGVISQKPSLFQLFFGGTSTEGFREQFRALLADETVGAIVLDVNSPGGNVAGVPELADVVYAARGQKPVIAVANTLAASAAYWIASQADEMVVTPSGMAGSIGVFSLHADESRAWDALGVTWSLIHAGKYKVEGNPFEPLDEEARAAIQHEVDVYYGMFVDAVARGRGAKAADVRAGYGEGRVLTARDAVRAGLADRVETLESVVARALRSKRGRGSAASADGADGAEPPTAVIARTDEAGGPAAAGDEATAVWAADLDRRQRRTRRWQTGATGRG